MSTRRANAVACCINEAAALAVLAPHPDHSVQVGDTELAGAAQPLQADTHSVGQGRQRSPFCSGNAAAHSA